MGKSISMNEVVYFWNGWEPVLRILVVGTFTYLGIVLLLRISGKRTLANMNAFDFIITVALGSSFGRILTAKSVSVTEAIVAFGLLVFLQYVLSIIEVRSTWFKKFVSSNPSLIYYNGNFIKKKLKKERIREDDVISVVRKRGFGNLDEVQAIVVETDGELSVIKKTGGGGELTYKELL